MSGFDERRWIGGAALPKGARALEKMLALAAEPDAPAALRDMLQVLRVGGPTSDFVSLLQLVEDAKKPNPPAGLLGRLRVDLIDELEERARAVGLIRLPAGSPATGFLIDESRLLTNFHVLSSADKAVGADVVFGFDGSGSTDPRKLLPEKFFWCDAAIDAAVVAVERKPGKVWGAIALSASGAAAVGDPAFIIQHPMGGVKQVCVRDNEIRGVSDAVVQYFTDTKKGSSGSPVFDHNMNIIALHREGGDTAVPGPAGIVYFKNQGTRIERVREALAH